jgi:hypothetical protein
MMQCGFDRHVEFVLNFVSVCKMRTEQSYTGRILRISRLVSVKHVFLSNCYGLNAVRIR